MATYNKTITCWDQSGNYYTCLGGKVYYAVATSTTSQPATPSLTTSSSSVSVPTSSTVSTDKVSNSVDINYAWPTTSGTYFTYAAQYYNGSSWASEGPVVWKGYYRPLDQCNLTISVRLTWTTTGTVYLSYKVTLIDMLESDTYLSEYKRVDSNFTDTFTCFGTIGNPCILNIEEIVVTTFENNTEINGYVKPSDINVNITFAKNMSHTFVVYS